MEMSVDKASTLLACGVDHRKFLSHRFLSYDSKMCQPQFKSQSTFAFWVAMITVTILTIGNLILTLTMIGVLRLGKGIHGIELIPEKDVIKFYGTTDLDRVYNKNNGQIDGFTDVPVSVVGDESGVFVKLNRNGQSQSRIVMNKSGTNFKSINSFGIKDPLNGEFLFTTHRPHYVMPGGASNLIARGISASKLSSPIGKPLQIQADTRIYVKGSEGIIMESFNTFIGMDYNIIVNSTQGSIILKEGDGIYLNTDKIPVITSDFTKRSAVGQYKICVCMPNGVLFRILIPKIRSERKAYSWDKLLSLIVNCSPEVPDMSDHI